MGTVGTLSVSNDISYFHLFSFQRVRKAAYLVFFTLVYMHHDDKNSNDMPANENISTAYNV